MKFYKKIMLIFVLVCSLILFSWLIKKNYTNYIISNISVSWTECRKADDTEIANFPFYTRNNEAYFYGLSMSQENNLSVIKTDYIITDYIPYSITIKIKNNSKKTIIDSMLVGVYSNECVFTKVNTENGWFAQNIANGAEYEEQFLIWFNKAMTEEEINQYLCNFQFSYSLTINNTFFPNVYSPLTVTVQSEKTGTERQGTVRNH